MQNRLLAAAGTVAALWLSAGSASAAQCGANTPDGVPGVDKKAGVIKLGTIEPMTGRASLVGIGAAQGIDIAIQELNAKGGIGGCKFEVVTLDNQYQLDVTVSSARRLVDRDKVWALIAPTSSAYLPAIYSTLQESGTPMWGPIEPSDQNVREVYLVGTPRAEQTRICIDYFADHGVKKVAAISQNNDIGKQTEDGMQAQSKVRGLEVAAVEKVDIQAPNMTAAVLNVIKSGAGGVITALDAGSLPTALNGLRESGFNGPICSDAASAAVGSMSIVGSANPDAANGFLGALQIALTSSDHPMVQKWKKAADAYTGQFKNGAPGFSLQSYAYTMSLAALMERLDGNLSRENFHKVAESTRENPIKMDIMPDVACGPLPGGHTCAKGAGLAQLDAHTKTWTQIQEFRSPKQ